MPEAHESDLAAPFSGRGGCCSDFATLSFGVLRICYAVGAGFWSTLL